MVGALGGRGRRGARLGTMPSQLRPRRRARLACLAASLCNPPQPARVGVWPWPLYRRRAAVSSCLSRPRASPASAAASFSAALSSSTCCTAAWNAAAAWSIRPRAWPACCSSEDAAFSASLHTSEDRGGAGSSDSSFLYARGQGTRGQATLSRAKVHATVSQQPGSQQQHVTPPPAATPPCVSLGLGRRLLGLIHGFGRLSSQRRQLLLGLLAQLSLACTLSLPAEHRLGGAVMPY